MAYIQWSPLFSVGVPAFDSEHRLLFGLMNGFYESVTSGQGLRDAFSTLNRLIRYAEDHFAHEERVLEAHGYPERIRHARDHERLVREVFDLNARLGAGEEQLPDALMEFLNGWLLKHVLSEDK